MSGHSKWKQIKRQKAVTDVARGKIFSKLARIITVAAREGEDPTTNAKLRMAIEKAKVFNMPKENIERAIKRGIGREEGAQIEKISYEAFGPGNIALIIESLTDNKNRTTADIKHILNAKGARLAQPGSVKWMFDQKGVLETKILKDKKEEIELAAIEAGAEDVKEKDEILEIYTAPEQLDKVRKKLEEQGIKIENFSIDWVPKNEIAITDEELKKQIEMLFDTLDQHDDVEEIYSNLKT